ncbi:hypothetical protein [Janthinobacterium fluminis]|uniref:Uncharacterized protein n=1 Tax=Janthinobacterium fluminis TaxID=2987524 RepID=A0ABT5JWV0_9BURK|nr:hypothetical protein [Janthinobacterium fluminis]MDC8756951.1 hypothetical protein [Janthinobacterium fluminis]
MATYLDLQNGFYNGFSQGLGFAPDIPFQMIQPSPPLIAGANQDQQLWNYFNNIPPFSLTQNYIASGGNQFTSDYSGLFSALQGAPNNFSADVGPKCNTAWDAFVATLPYTTSLSQFPMIFRNWAVRNGFISVANVGASDLAQLLLDPISSAQLSLMLYKPAGATPPNWGEGYLDLVNLLNVAPNRAFSLNSSTMNSSVSNSWTKSANEGFFGLWGGSSSSSSQSSTFAASNVTVAATFQHALQFGATPGDWYNSSAMSLAYANKDGAPWVASSPINWNNTFGSRGNMQRFASTLVVVSGMNVVVTSSAVFSKEDQNAIHNNSGAGMWPFYSANSSSGSSTDVQFNNQGNMTVTFTSQPNVPIVVGAIVEPVSVFVGQDAAQAYMKHLASIRGA